MTTTTTPAVHVRWCILRDHRAIRPWLPPGWTLKKLRRYQGMKTCIGMVAEVGEKVVGLVVYRLASARLHLLALAVDPKYRRQGVGSELLAKFKAKMGTHRRAVGVCVVPERSLNAQVTLRANGWVCTRIVPDQFGEEAGFVFRTGLS